MFVPNTLWVQNIAHTYSSHINNHLNISTHIDSNACSVAWVCYHSTYIIYLFHGRELDGVTSSPRWRSESDVSGSVHFLHLKVFLHALFALAVIGSDHKPLTNLVRLCLTVIAFISREVLKSDGVTLLCWWGNIHKFCISDEVTSYSQSMYLTISVIIRAWTLLKIHV